VLSRHKNKAAEMSIEIIDWMRQYTIDDLKEMAVKTEKNGGDASSLRHLLTDLELLQNELLHPHQLQHEHNEIESHSY